MYNRLLKNWWLPLKQPDIACMKVGYDNRNSSYIEVYVFVVQYMLALSTIFFFLENLVHKSKLTKLSLFLTFGEASLKLMCENPLVCVW